MGPGRSWRYNLAWTLSTVDRQPNDAEEDTMRFDGTRVVVTGGARGIGTRDRRRVPPTKAHTWSRPTCWTTTSRRSKQRIRRATACRVHTADLADVDQVRDIVPAAVGLLGGVDVLVNNAGVQPDGPVPRRDAGRHRRVPRGQRPRADAADARRVPPPDRSRRTRSRSSTSRARTRSRTNRRSPSTTRPRPRSWR